MSKNVSDFNPYESLPQSQKASPGIAAGQAAFGRPSPRRARLGFFDCFFEAKEFLGKDYWLLLGVDLCRYADRRRRSIDCGRADLLRTWALLSGGRATAATKL